MILDSSGGPRKWYPQLWAEKSLSVCVCLCLFVTKTAFFGRFLRFLRFPFSILSDAFFVQNPSGFVLFSPFLFTIRALFVVRSPQSSPEAPQSPATCPDHPLRCAGVRAPSPKHLSPPAVSARLRSKRCLESSSTPGCPGSDDCCHMRQIHTGAALELARVATPILWQDVCTATTSERAQPKTRHQSGRAVTVGVRTRLVPFGAKKRKEGGRAKGAQSTRIFGTVRRGSLHSHYRAAASISRRPSHDLPCMP